MIISICTPAMTVRAEPSTTSDDLEARAFLGAVVTSTTANWSAAFKARGLTYVQPRVLYLNLPVGHPGRGTGYSSSIGLVIDLNDMISLKRALGSQGQMVEALITAHEIGHHVQHLLSISQTQFHLEDGAAKELQADCYSGWWLGHHAEVAHFPYTPTDPSQPEFRVSLSKALQVLDVLESGEIPLRRNTLSLNHGRFDQRLAAIELGFGDGEPWHC